MGHLGRVAGAALTQSCDSAVVAVVAEGVSAVVAAAAVAAAGDVVAVASPPFSHSKPRIPWHFEGGLLLQGFRL